jgi:hypothetical protein
VTLLFLLLLVWERRRGDEDTERRARADRWLVAAALVYGVAVANHSLTLLLAPAIALFVLAVAPRILLNWRLVLKCVGVLVVAAVVIFLEMPIRAAMHAPVVYGHPDTWAGFQYVVLGQQFTGSLWDPFGQLGTKFAAVMSLMASWLGPLGFVAAIGVGTSVVRRPRFVLLCVVAFAVTCGFAASYANSDIERYFLVPIFIAFTFVGLGLADAISVVVALANAVSARFAAAGDGEASRPDDSDRWTPTLATVEALVAVALVAVSVGIVPVRQALVSGGQAGAVSRSDQRWDETWTRSVLAPVDQGGLPHDAVIVDWWGDSTRIWYGQYVEGLRQDIYVVDDSTRVPAGDNLGNVWDVIDKYLGQRPVFVDRFSGGCDGTDVLQTMYEMKPYQLPNGVTMFEVISRKGSVTGNCG